MMKLRAAYWTVVIALPVVLLIIAGRLVMTPTLLHFIYTQTGIPQDPYGFTLEDRLSYGALGVQYLLERRPIDFLAEQTLPGERCFPVQQSPCQMFNNRELKHMADVQNVTWGLFLLGISAALLLTLAAVWLATNEKQLWLISALEVSSALLLAGIAAAAVAVVFAWDAFFDGFHALFFEDGTWRFWYSDTLIRLYPESFWINGAIVIVVLAGSSAFVILVASHRYRSCAAREAAK
jgi:integral membrane protein (TIGR01906 family)